MFLTRLPLRIATAFDLHVLGLPPAFVLSQDQTLKLYENSSRLVTVIKHVPLYKDTMSTSPKHTRSMPSQAFDRDELENT